MTEQTGPGLPDTVAAELGVDEIHVLMSRIRAAAGGLVRRRAVVGSMGSRCRW
jgi:hypothetical protein